MEQTQHVPRPTFLPCVPIDTNSTSKDPVEKKDETPFGVSMGSGSLGRGWGWEAGLEAVCMSFLGRAGSSCQLLSQASVPTGAGQVWGPGSGLLGRMEKQFATGSYGGAGEASR